MKKLLFAFILSVFMAFTSCDCSCDMEPVELKNPEVQAYKLYRSGNDYDYTRLYVYKYEIPEAYIYRFVINGDTRNVNIVPKNQYVNPPQDTESIISKDTYFDY